MFFKKSKRLRFFNNPYSIIFDFLLISAATECLAYDAVTQIEAQDRHFQHAQSKYSDDEISNQFSVSLESEISYLWNDERNTFVVKPFVRLDAVDSNRTHADFRELKLHYTKENYDFDIGYSTIYWGVLESQQLVNIINQSDWLEHPDGKIKLGQPLAHMRVRSDFGLWESYLLLGFREREFSGDGEGRFQLPFPLAKPSIYESSKKDNHIDYAFRWSNTLDRVDLGISVFSGTNRDPFFTINNNAVTTITPNYELIEQIAADLQFIQGEWILKLESARRESSSVSFNALAAGLEYGFYGILGSQKDLSWFIEYNYNSEGLKSRSRYQDDAFLGCRIRFNNLQGSELRIGLEYDTQIYTKIFKSTFSHRLTDSLSLKMEAFYGNSKDPRDPFYFFRDEDFFQTSLIHYF